MSRQIPNAGTYRARCSGPVVIYESPKTKALCAALPVMLVAAEGFPCEVAWSGKHTVTIVKGDGTVQQRSLDTLKKVFGWDGLDPFWLSDQDLSEIEFEIVGEHETYQPDPTETDPEPEARLVFKIKWLNAPGESAQMPEAADRKTVLAKFGSKFRALAGGKAITPKPAGAKPTPAAKPEPADQDGDNVDEPTPAPAKATPAKATPAKTSPPAASKTPPGKAKPKAAGGQPRTSTMDECWAKLQEVRPDLADEAALGEVWYRELGEQVPGKENPDVTIQEWGAFMTHLESLAS